MDFLTEGYSFRSEIAGCKIFFAPAFYNHLSLLLPEMIIGLIVRLCGEIGEIMILSSSGDNIGPPTLRLYAVDPVAVETISPSDPVCIQINIIDIYIYCYHARVAFLNGDLIERR